MSGPRRAPRRWRRRPRPPGPRHGLHERPTHGRLDLVDAVAGTAIPRLPTRNGTSSRPRTAPDTAGSRETTRGSTSRSTHPAAAAPMPSATSRVARSSSRSRCGGGPRSLRRRRRQAGEPAPVRAPWPGPGCGRGRRRPRAGTGEPHDVRRHRHGRGHQHGQPSAQGPTGRQGEDREEQAPEPDRPEGLTGRVRPHPSPAGQVDRPQPPGGRREGAGHEGGPGQEGPRGEVVRTPPHDQRTRHQQHEGEGDGGRVPAHGRHHGVAHEGDPDGELHVEGLSGALDAVVHDVAHVTVRDLAVQPLREPPTVDGDDEVTLTQRGVAVHPHHLDRLHPAVSLRVERRGGQ